MKRDSIWIANFKTYEDVQDYKRLMENEFGDRVSQMKSDFKISDYDDEVVFETYLDQKSDKLETLIKGNPGDYQYIKQLKTKKLSKKYNTLIIYSGFDYEAEQSKTGLKQVTGVGNEMYEIEFLGVFDFDFTKAKKKYPKTLSKYGDEQYEKKGT